MKELSKIMKSSWLIGMETGMSRSFSLRKSWENFKLQKAMMTQVVRFSYMKVNGGVRNARGTTSGMFVPGLGVYTGSTEENLKTVTYFDMDKNGWRSFRRENLIGMSN